MAPIFTLEDKSTETEAGCLSLLPVWKEEVTSEHEEMSPSLVQVKPQPLQIKEEQQEELHVLQRPVEAAGSTLILRRLTYGPRYVQQMEYADFLHQIKEEQEEGLLQRPGSTLTLAEKSEDDGNENRDCGASSQLTSGQLLSSHLSESDITDDSDDWEETREGQSALNKLNSKPFPDLNSSKQTPSMRAHTGKERCRCKECGRVFGRMSSLKRHMMTHRSAKPFPCTVCSRAYNSRHTLNLHMRIHTGETLYNCTDCSRVCLSPSHLREHMKKHTGEKPYNCTECGRPFSYASALKRHLMTRSSERPFNCIECGRVFDYVCRLRLHSRSHRGEKRVARTDCGHVFNDKHNLRQHMVTHTGKNLKEHMKTHTGEKVITCTECGKVCKYKRNLKRHMSTHTGSKNCAVNSKCVGLKPEPLQIKEEQELLHCPEEVAGSMLTSLAVTHEDDDNEKNSETELLASTSNEHMETQADLEDCGATQPASDQLLSPHCSESDITDDSDFWEETREDQDLKSSKQTPSTRAATASAVNSNGFGLEPEPLQNKEEPEEAAGSSLTCTECGKVFSLIGSLKRHMRTHRGSKRYSCSECGEVFGHMSSLNHHRILRNHTGGQLFTCSACDQVFSGTCDLMQHLMMHTSFIPSITVTSKTLV